MIQQLLHLNRCSKLMKETIQLKGWRSSFYLSLVGSCCDSLFLCETTGYDASIYVVKLTCVRSSPQLTLKHFQMYGSTLKALGVWGSPAGWSHLSCQRVRLPAACPQKGVWDLETRKITRPVWSDGDGRKYTLDPQSHRAGHRHRQLSWRMKGGLRGLRCWQGLPVHQTWATC